MNHFNSESNLDRHVLDIYVNMYNSTLEQINLLQSHLTDIKRSIDDLVGLNNPSGIRRNTRSANMSSSNDSLLYNNYNLFNPITSRDRVSRNLLNPNFLLRYGTTNTNNRRSQERNYTNTNTNVLDLLREYYTPVTVYPSQTQINNAVRNIFFENIENPINNSCPISLERFTPDQNVSQILYCGHIFNTTELNSWFRMNVRCPVCRYDIRNYISGQNNTEQEHYESDSESESESVSEVDNSRNEETNRNLSNRLTDYFQRELLNLLNNDNATTQIISDPSNNIYGFTTTITTTIDPNE
jgi:hypothetical protein